MTIFWNRVVRQRRSLTELADTDSEEKTPSSGRNKNQMKTVESNSKQRPAKGGSKVAKADAVTGDKRRGSELDSANTSEENAEQGPAKPPRSARSKRTLTKKK